MWEKLVDEIKRGDRTTAKDLISEIVNNDPKLLNKKNSEGSTALILAASKGLVDTCELLISQMVNIEGGDIAINAINNNRQTALMWAAYKGLTSVCEKLLTKMSQEAIESVNMKSLQH